MYKSTVLNLEVEGLHSTICGGYIWPVFRLFIDLLLDGMTFARAPNSLVELNKKPTWNKIEKADFWITSKTHP